MTEAGVDNDPFQAYLLKESISTAYLLLLQQLSYVERAVLLLREALQYDYDEIADIIGKSSTNCRQIFHRAKRSLGMHPISNDEGHPARDQTNLASSQERTSQLVDQFMRALATGDIDKLMNVLSRDAILFMDSGGKVTAPPRSIQGSERISRFLASLPTKIPLVYRTNYPSSTANWESSCMRTDKRYPSFRFLLRTAALPGYTPLLIRKS